METRGLWDPHLPRWRTVLRPPAPTLSHSGSGGLGRGAPGFPLSGSRGRGRRSGPAPSVCNHPLPVTRGSWGVEGGRRGSGSAQMPRAGCEGRRQCSEPPPARVGSRKEGRRSGPPCPATGSRWGEGGVGWGGREGGRADSPPAASSAAGIFFLIIECEV